MDAAISCQNLLKYYGAKKVLKGVNLEVPVGCLFALLGTNGAGKTSLIRTLLGLIPKSGGSVNVLGEEPYRIGPLLREKIGYVSEEQGLYSWMRVQELICFCRSLYQKWDDGLVRKYLERFNLDPHAKIATLSKGQTVKLALILSLAPQPELLILDEPMTGLDPLAQHEFLQVIMRDLNLDGRTIFFSTHNLADVNAVAQRVAILNDGIIQAVGSISEVCGQVRKFKCPKNLDSDLLKHGVVLSETEDELELLVPTGSFPEIAATGEGVASSQEPVNLEEAFLFFCGRGRQ